MKRMSNAIRLLLAMLAVATVVASVPAYATFIVDPNPGGLKFYYDGANHNVAAFSGQVGTQSSGVFVDATAFMNVDTANGYATIKPANSSVTLTSLIFTPRDSSIFGDFSFRGQLESTANGTVHVQVKNLGGFLFDFDFTGLGSSADFDRIGIHSTDGDSILSVEISAIGDGFKEVKQIEFSNKEGGGGGGGNPVPEPSTLLLLGAGLAGLGLFGRRKLSK